jgi:hypothetical protein
VSDLSHLWQRFVLAAALVFGLALGVAATVFGYSNTNTVTLGFSVYHLRGVPLWSVAIVPLVLVLAAGTLYHWWNSLHHFTEHMRHRRRVKELEAELASLKTRLDSVLEMPDQSGTTPAPPAPSAVVETVETTAIEPFEPEPLAIEPVVGSNGDDKPGSNGRKRRTKPETETVAVATDGSSAETEPRAETPAGA